MTRFATHNTGGPDIYNIQLNFWRAAVEKYYYIAARCRFQDLYYSEDFFVDATLSLIAAGASLTALVGQISPPRKDGLPPSPRPQLERDLGPETELYKRAAQFLDLYDALRHFGRGNYNQVEELIENTEVTFTQHLRTVQEVWCHYLRKDDLRVTDAFTYSFDLIEA